MRNFFTKNSYLYTLFTCLFLIILQNFFPTKTISFVFGGLYVTEHVKLNSRLFYFLKPEKHRNMLDSFFENQIKIIIEQKEKKNYNSYFQRLVVYQFSHAVFSEHKECMMVHP